MKKRCIWGGIVGVKTLLNGTNCNGAAHQANLILPIVTLTVVITICRNHPRAVEPKKKNLNPICLHNIISFVVHS